MNYSFKYGFFLKFVFINTILYVCVYNVCHNDTSQGSQKKSYLPLSIIPKSRIQDKLFSVIFIKYLSK